MNEADLKSLTTCEKCLAVIRQKDRMPHEGWHRQVIKDAIKATIEERDRQFRMRGV
jgi:hypothetical protein